MPNYYNGSEISSQLWIYNENIQAQLDEANEEIERLHARIEALEEELANCGEPAPIEMYFDKDFEGVSLTDIGKGQMSVNNWGLDELPICKSKLNFIANSVSYTPCAMVSDPAGTGRRVLYMSVLDDDPTRSGTSRAQLDIDFDESIMNQQVIHMSDRKFLHPDMAHMVNIKDFNKTWFTLHEFWFERKDGDNDAGSGRITLYVKEIVEGKLNLQAEMQRTPGSDQIILWEINNLDYVIPYGKWATWDVYLKRGEGAEGQYKLTITVDGEEPVVVFDIRKTTFLTDVPDRRCNYFAPFKLYGGDGPLYDAMRNAGKKIASYHNDFKWYKA